MTTSAWTKNEIASRFETCETLRQIISLLETDYAARGEVICEIRVNGMVLNEQDEVMFAESPREGIFELAVQTNKPSDLISQALKSALDMVPQLEANAITTSELLRAGDRAGAARKFHETIEGCQWMIETLVHIRGAAQGIGAPIQNQAAWQASEKQISKVVTEVSDAYGKSDWVLVADLFEYELTSSLQSWKATIDTVLQAA